MNNILKQTLTISVILLGFSSFSHGQSVLVQSDRYGVQYEHQSFAYLNVSAKDQDIFYKFPNILVYNPSSRKVRNAETGKKLFGGDPIPYLRKVLDYKLVSPTVIRLESYPYSNDVTKVDIRFSKPQAADEFFNMIQGGELRNVDIVVPRTNRNKIVSSSDVRLFDPQNEYLLDLNRDSLFRPNGLGKKILSCAFRIGNLL